MPLNFTHNSKLYKIKKFSKDDKVLNENFSSTK